MRVIPYYVNFAGCPNQCVFCNQTIINETDNSDDDLLILLDRIASDEHRDKVEIAFFGGSFTNIKRARLLKLLAIVRPYLERGIIHSLRCSTRPDGIDQDIIKLLVDNRFSTVELGVQSLNDDVLAASKRGLLADRVRHASSLIKDAGLTLIHQMMIGLPTDTYDSFKSSVESSIAMHPDGVRIYPTLVLAGTELAELYKMGLYQPLTLDEAITYAKYALQRYLASGIDIVKMGLHANELMNDRLMLLAGPYHPAFRELVESEVIYDALYSAFIKAGISRCKVTLNAEPKLISRIAGHKRINTSKLEREFDVSIAIHGSTAVKCNAIDVKYNQSTVTINF